MLGWYSSCLFNFRRYDPIVFQRTMTNLHSHRAGEFWLFHIHTNMAFLSFNFGISGGFQSYLFVLLIFISMVTTDYEYFLICLLVIKICLFVEYLFKHLTRDNFLQACLMFAYSLLGVLYTFFIPIQTQDFSLNVSILMQPGSAGSYHLLGKILSTGG